MEKIKKGSNPPRTPSITFFQGDGAGSIKHAHPNANPAGAPAAAHNYGHWSSIKYVYLKCLYYYGFVVNMDQKIYHLVITRLLPNLVSLYEYFREFNYDRLMIGGVYGEYWGWLVSAYITHHLPGMAQGCTCMFTFSLK